MSNKQLSNQTYFETDKTTGEPKEARPPRNTVYYCWTWDNGAAYPKKTSRLALDSQEINAGDLIETRNITDGTWEAGIVRQEYDRDHGNTRWFIESLDSGRPRTLGLNDTARWPKKRQTTERGQFDIVFDRNEGYYSLIDQLSAHVVCTADQKSDILQIVDSLVRYGYNYREA